MVRRALSAISALFLVAGFVQGARGGWIYAKAGLAQILLHRAWDQTLDGASQVRAWPWADTWPIARLVLEGHGRELIVLAGANGRNLAFAPGHLDGSTLPGSTGTCVVAGHRDTHFAALEELKPGDRVRLESTNGITHSYRVAETAVVHETDTWAIVDSVNPTLVLITCWPFNSPMAGGPLRYVVWAEGE
ncbi:MAG: class GN sortase [bacterium]|nr:class GN sortase [bacterium]